MMLTPETSEGAPRSRLQLEVTPNYTPNTPRSTQRTPGKTDQVHNLHFNSQLLRTPSTHHLHLKHHVSSPLCSTPPDAPIARVRVTPRAVPRNRCQFSTPSSSGSTSSCRSIAGTPGRSMIRTPNGILYNPFEIEPEQMKEWTVSPGMFAIESNGEQANSPFWSIDHIAMMQPANIDETSLQRFLTADDSATDERHQHAINQFFTNNDVILPSPWSEDANKRPFILPQTPCTPGVVQMAHPSASSSCAKNNSEQKSKEVSCQTALTLPMDFDLQKLLGKHYTHECKDEGIPDPLSTSSLRRKLFFHGEGSNPPSPVHEMDGQDQGLPMEDENNADIALTPQSSKQSSLHTPGSNVFSSSPIHSDSDRGSSPGMRRCSTAPELMASPSLSPIGSSKRRPERRSFMKEADFISDNTPLCQPLHHTPSSGRPSLPFSSPGVSPIRLDISHSKATGEAYNLQHKDNFSSVSSPAVVFSPALSQTSAQQTDMGKNEEKEMEVDRDDSFNKEADIFASSTGFKILRGFPIGFSYSAADQSTADEQPAHSTQVGITQDTGYQTNSLQSLNQDTGLHTNLTNQFGSMLPISGRDTGLEEDYMSSMEYNITDPTSLISSTRLPQPVNPDDESTRDVDFKLPSAKNTPKTTSFAYTNLNNKSSSRLDESLILRQARKALGKPEAGSPQKQSTTQDEKGANIFASEIQSQWSVNVPTPLRQKLHQVGLIDKSSASGEKLVMPSMVALKAIKRAGQDFELYCQPQATKSNPQRPSIIKKEILTPDFIDDEFLLS